MPPQISSRNQGVRCAANSNKNDVKGGTISELTNVEPKSRNLATMAHEEVDVSQIPTYESHYRTNNQELVRKRAFSPTVEVMRPEIVVKKPHHFEAQQLFSPTVELVNEVNVSN